MSLARVGRFFAVARGMNNANLLSYGATANVRMASATPAAAKPAAQKSSFAVEYALFL